MTTDAAPSVQDLLQSAGFGTLGTDPPPEAVEAVLRTLTERLNGSDPIRTATARSAAVDALVRAGVSGPDELVAAALGTSDVPRPWPDSPQLPGPSSPEPVPTDALPPALRDHVESVAAATQTPPDLGALIGLACVSTAIGGRAVVEVDGRGWSEPLNVYTAVVLPPASRKSPVHGRMTEPLRAWERARVQEVGPAHRRARDRVDVAESALQSAKRAAAAGKVSVDEVEAARAELDKAEAAVPPLPRLLASDATPEALVRLLAEQDGRIALVEPEADPLGMADGRYSDDARVDELLRAWGGEPIRVDRVGRDPVHVERPALTLGLCVQPEALAALRHGKVHRGRGLWGRILWCQPPHGLGSRLTGRDVPELDPAAAARYGRMLRRLLEVSGISGMENRVMTLDEDARDVLYAYEAEVEAELRDGGRLASIRDWAGKVVGQSVRLAALVELAARADDGRPLWEPIGRWGMEAGVHLVRALTTHALAVLTEMGMDRATADQRYLLARLQELPEGTTETELRAATRGRASITGADHLARLIEELEDRGCVRRVEQPQDGPGRPPSPVLAIHPDILKMHTENTGNPADKSEEGNKRYFRYANPGGNENPDLPPDDPFEAAEAGR